MSSARAAIVFAALAVTLGLTACGSDSSSSSSEPRASGAASSPAPAAPQVAIADADLPPLPVPPFAAARPMEIVRAVYVFAARHPEVLSHVPCFCGCETRGHRHNDDCFVAARDANGRTTAWEPHGVG